MPFGGVTVKDVDSHEFVKAFAQWLKKGGKIKLPDYVDYIKTGKQKELAPYDRDWYFVRAASVARHIYLRQGVGIGGLRKIYGGRKNNGTTPSHYVKAYGSVHRHIVQQLEKLKLVEKLENGGRKMTSQGQRDLDRIAGQVLTAKKE